MFKGQILVLTMVLSPVSVGEAPRNRTTSEDRNFRLHRLRDTRRRLRLTDLLSTMDGRRVRRIPL